MRIVETDNFGSDYPNEKFVNLPDHLSRKTCEEICALILDELPDDYPRFYKVVENDYELVPGFEP